MWKPEPGQPIPPGWESTDMTRDIKGTIRRYWWTPIAVALLAVFFVSIASSDDENGQPAATTEVST